MTPRLSSFLNASRWWAAFFVVAHHVRHLVLADASTLVLHGPLVKLFYFATSLGTEAVMIFFVISGYLIGGKAILRRASRGFDVADYFSHRVSRIYTVLVPALLAGGALDWLGLHHFDRSGLYTNGAHHPELLTYVSIKGNLNVATLLGNLAMLVGIRSDHLGTNSPLWSLTYEWWYYCLFAAGIVACGAGKAAGRIAAAVALAAMCLFLPHVIVLFMSVWLVGAGAAVYAESRAWKPPAWLAYVVFGGALVALRWTARGGAIGGDEAYLVAIGRGLVVGVTFAALLVAYHREGAQLPFARANEELAKFSYSLYLVHFPMIAFCIAALDDLFGITFQRPPNAAGIAYFCAILAFVTVYAWAFSQVTERHTARVRALIVSSFGARRRSVRGERRFQR